MWQPTHVKVTIKQARNLISKGKNGTNDAFVVIGIGKEKYQTSVKEKASSPVEWREECELAIPSQGNKANIQLTICHHKGLGLEDFLGQVSLPLTDFDVYEKPKYRSYRLKGKPEKDKKKGEKERGELEVMVNFTVKSESFLDATKKEKHKSSLSSLKHLGGSLMSIGSKEKQGLKNFAKSVSSKMDKIARPKKKKKQIPADNAASAFPSDLITSQQYYGHADPGVISDDEDNDDFNFDDDIKVSTRTSSPISTMSRGSSLVHDQVLDTDYEVGSYEDPEQDFSCSLGKTPPKPPRIVDSTKESDSCSSGVRVPLMNSERVTSFFDAKPSVRLAPTTPEISRTIIEEEAFPFESKEEEELAFHPFKIESKSANLQKPSVDSISSIIEPFALKREPPTSEYAFNPYQKIVKESEPEVKPRKKFLFEPEAKIETLKSKIVIESPSSRLKVVSTGLEPDVEQKVEVLQESVRRAKILPEASEAELKVETPKEEVKDQETFHDFHISRKELELELEPEPESVEKQKTTVFQETSHLFRSPPEELEQEPESVEKQKTTVFQETSHLFRSPPEELESEQELPEIQSVSDSVHKNFVGEYSFLSAKSSVEFCSPIEDLSFSSCDRRNEDAKIESSAKKNENLDKLFAEDVKDIALEEGSQKVVWLESFVEVSSQSQEEVRNRPDSAIFLDNDQESNLSSRPRSTSNASSVLSSSSVSDLPLETLPLSEAVEDSKRGTAKPLLKSSSDMDVLFRHGSAGRKLNRTKQIQSGTDALKTYTDVDTGPVITRSESLNEKRSPPVVVTPAATMATVHFQPTIVDEWERKLYGRSGLTGSTENMSISGSRSSLNTSRESSVYDVRKEDSFTRLPEVKALTLERPSPFENGDDSKKQKKQKQKISLKTRLFSKGESRERLNEEGRFVEGGNDRLPSIPTRPSKLPQEIHDKFAGKSREDLLEVILNLQSSLEKQVKYSNDLEDYIDNLLLRVMEATPHILQAPIETGKAFKGY